ncbi:MAG: hypothetical protein GY765_20690 [bacterium]|nr:hypothetical protein [bacterium]
MKTQDAEKWILSFYQIGMFPRFKGMGRIQSAIASFTTSEDRQTSKGDVKKLLMDLLPKIEHVDRWMVDNIGKLFVNSGATVHTLLIKPVFKAPMDNYSYQPLPTDTENILRKISRLTGGSVNQSMDVDEFIAKISAKEDIQYLLTYVPEADEKKNSLIKIRLNKKGDYRLSYDNQRRPNYFKKILSKIKMNNPQVKIEHIAFNAPTLSVVVSGMKSIPAAEDKNKKIGKIEAKVMILDENSQVVWDIQKKYRSKSGRSVFLLKPPPLKKGHYNVMVEVKDLLSWKTDASGDTIEVTR